MDEKRTYSQAQFKALALDTNAYQFNDQSGTFEATLDLKVWGNNKNLLSFFSLTDGRKFISSAPFYKQYFGLPDIPVGTKLIITYAPNIKGKVFLVDVRQFD